jgi:hypothetical protein
MIGVCCPVGAIFLPLVLGSMRAAMAEAEPPAATVSQARGGASINIVLITNLAPCQHDVLCSDE